MIGFCLRHWYAAKMGWHSYRAFERDFRTRMDMIEAQPLAPPMTRRDAEHAILGRSLTDEERARLRRGRR